MQACHLNIHCRFWHLAWSKTAKSENLQLGNRDVPDTRFDQILDFWILDIFHIVIDSNRTSTAVWCTMVAYGGQLYCKLLDR
jgi:hypothetical protein